MSIFVDGFVPLDFTVAEFVENEAVLRRIQEIGVDYGQGYGLGKPQPLIDQLGLTESRSAAASQ